MHGHRNNNNNNNNTGRLQSLLGVETILLGNAIWIL